MVKTAVGLLVCALFVPWAYVLLPDRVLEQMERARTAPRVPLSLRLELQGLEPAWPTEVRVDLHPVGGVRVDDRRGGRWVLRSGRVVASSQYEVPVWLPQLDFLMQSSAETLSAWLEGAGVDLRQNALGRCGADDCFVLGGRAGAAQLWVAKEAFRPRAWVTPTGRRFELGPYRAWGSVKFPSKIDILDDSGRIATLRTLDLEPAPDLGPRDFSDAWTRL